MATHAGKRNPNYKHGKYAFGNYCLDCKKKIDGRSKRCCLCNSKNNNSFKGKSHSLKSRKKIGIESKKKFTKEYINKIRNKCEGNKKRAINGYTLIKSYDHPNKNSHNDVLEHILVMSNKIGRAIKKGEIVHHKDFVRDNNKISNLWLYKNISEHGKCTKTIFKLVKELMKMKIIEFKNGEYAIKRRSAKAVSGELI